MRQLRPMQSVTEGYGNGRKQHLGHHRQRTEQPRHGSQSQPEVEAVGRQGALHRLRLQR